MMDVHCEVSIWHNDFPYGYTSLIMPGTANCSTVHLTLVLRPEFSLCCECFRQPEHNHGHEGFTSEVEHIKSRTLYALRVGKIIKLRISGSTYVEEPWLRGYGVVEKPIVVPVELSTTD